MRQAGFYWVKYEGAWVVAEWYITSKGLTYWFMTGDEDARYDNYFEEIDERRVTQWPLPNKCEHEWNGHDKHGHTICSKCGEGYT